MNKSKEDVSAKTTGSGATDDSINKSQQSSARDKTKDKSNISGSQSSNEKLRANKYFYILLLRKFELFIYSWQHCLRTYGTC